MSVDKENFICICTWPTTDMSSPAYGIYRMWNGTLYDWTVLLFFNIQHNFSLNVESTQLEEAQPSCFQEQINLRYLEKSLSYLLQKECFKILIDWSHPPVWNQQSCPLPKSAWVDKSTGKGRRLKIQQNRELGLPSKLDKWLLAELCLLLREKKKSFI